MLDAATFQAKRTVASENVYVNLARKLSTRLPRVVWPTHLQRVDDALVQRQVKWCFTIVVTSIDVGTTIDQQADREILSCDTCVNEAAACKRH